MVIRKANVDEADQCLECVKNSQLWDAYFKDNPTTEKIEMEIRLGRISVAVNEMNRCIGFMGIIGEGCFGKFPYLAILTVHEEYRSRGVGNSLLEQFEHEGFEKEDRLFILCSDFNRDGQSFYRNRGYSECGKIPDLFKNGVTEHIFVKYRDER